LKRELKLLQNLSSASSKIHSHPSSYSSGYSSSYSPTYSGSIHGWRPPYSVNNISPSIVLPVVPPFAPTFAPTPHAPVETEIPAPKNQENAAEGATDLCLICLAKIIKTVNIPCGHRVYCLTCVHLEKQQKKVTILSCPTCRSQLTKVMETF